MIHGHEMQIIVVIRLPEFGGETQIVVTVMRGEFVAADFVPLFGCFDARCAYGVDLQADGGTPRHCIFHKLDLVSVVREQERARAFQTLFRDNFLIRLQIKLRANGTVRPDYPGYVHIGLITETEMQEWTRDGLLLHQQAGANFNFTANAEGIDSLIAGGLLGVRANDHPMISLRAVADSKSRGAAVVQAEQT